MGEGKRHFGFPNEEPQMYYSEQEFKDGCTFNYWMGVGAGAVGVVGLLLLIGWVVGVL